MQNFFSVDAGFLTSETDKSHQIKKKKEKTIADWNRTIPRSACADSKWERQQLGSVLV